MNALFVLVVWTNRRQAHYQFFFYGLKSFFFLVFIVKINENPCSHRYDVENGSKIVIAFTDISGNSIRT